jgi:hypothetical protein
MSATLPENNAANTPSETDDALLFGANNSGAHYEAFT